jgi:molybdopterin synthase sulfur carrier subunit
MPLVWIPSLLRTMTGGEAAVTVPGETIGQVIDHLDERYPGIKGRLCQGDRLRPNIAVVVDGEVCRSGLQHRLIDTSEVCFLPALSGGVNGMWSASMPLCPRNDSAWRSAAAYSQVQSDE